MTNKEMYDLLLETVNKIPRDTAENLFTRSILYSTMTAIVNDKTKECAASMLIILTNYEDTIDGNRGLLN